MGDFSAVVERYRRARLSPRSRANLGAAPVALRNWAVNGGAVRLGITHGALSFWLIGRQSRRSTHVTAPFGPAYRQRAKLRALVPARAA